MWHAPCCKDGPDFEICVSVFKSPRFLCHVHSSQLRWQIQLWNRQDVRKWSWITKPCLECVTRHYYSLHKIYRPCKRLILLRSLRDQCCSLKSTYTHIKLHGIDVTASDYNHLIIVVLSAGGGRRRKSREKFIRRKCRPSDADVARILPAPRIMIYGSGT